MFADGFIHSWQDSVLPIFFHRAFSCEEGFSFSFLLLKNEAYTVLKRSY